MKLTLSAADTIADGALAACMDHGFSPMCVVVIDAGGIDLVVKRDERASSYRVDIARAKAAGCIGMGMGGRAIAARATKVPAFYAALTAYVALIQVPGGVLILSDSGAIIGAVGISGDTADNDEICALAGVTAAGLAALAGEPA